ncbi:MAG: hypothetical protein LBI87_09030 [Candidatus Accumulibacter sp.]|jgi:hypothetical protein|nr:hypothetical protein [Accumulibacter sp.]
MAFARFFDHGETRRIERGCFARDPAKASLKRDVWLAALRAGKYMLDSRVRGNDEGGGIGEGNGESGFRFSGGMTGFSLFFAVPAVVDDFRFCLSPRPLWLIVF